MFPGAGILCKARRGGQQDREDMRGWTVTPRCPGVDQEWWMETVFAKSIESVLVEIFEECYSDYNIFVGL